MDNRFFDPKNTIWLEIVRICGILLNFLLVIGAFLAVIKGWLTIPQFFGAILVTLVLHLFNMLALNALFNLQKLRINSDKIVETNNYLIKFFLGENNKNEITDDVLSQVSKEIDNHSYNNEKKVIKEKLKTKKVKEHDVDIQQYEKIFLPIDKMATTVVVDNGYDAIGENAFRNNKYLEEIFIPKSIEYIADKAFFNCFNLRDVYYQGNEKKWQEIYIGELNNELEKVKIHFGKK
jgi:hypothetical protein